MKEFYAALLAGRNLHVLTIKYDGECTYSQTMIMLYENPSFMPQIDSFFLFELTAFFKRAQPPLPVLETLSLDIFATVEGLAECTNTGAWRAHRQGTLSAIRAVQARAGGDHDICDRVVSTLEWVQRGWTFGARARNVLCVRGGGACVEVSARERKSWMM